MTAASSPAPVTVATLEAFSDAWNRHDIDALMRFMHEDCVFQTAAGNEACGTRHSGTAAVRKAFAAAWEAVPDAQWINGRHFVSGDFGTSQVPLRRLEELTGLDWGALRPFDPLEATGRAIPLGDLGAIRV